MLKLSFKIQITGCEEMNVFMSRSGRRGTRGSRLVRVEGCLQVDGGQVESDGVVTTQRLGMPSAPGWARLRIEDVPFRRRNGRCQHFNLKWD